MTSAKFRNFLVIPASFITPLFYTQKPKVRVLALHDISSEQTEEFVRKMKWLQSFANIISVRDVFDGKNLDSKKLNVAITFDDGFKCFSTIVAPILQRLSIPATFFVSSSAIGLEGTEAESFSHNNLKRSTKFEFMSEQELVNLSQKDLFEIGGHTRSHIDLGNDYLPEVLLKEITDDKLEIERMIGKQIDFFAYPFGGVKNISSTSASAIQAAGYKSAFTILPSFWRKTDDLLFIGRDSLTLNESDLVWSAWLAGGYDFLSSLKNKLK